MVEEKIAGAPISWGVCEVPGWGYQMDRERVLSEMKELGYSACEFGPLGFLPVDPRQRAEVLAEFNMKAVGGFVPVVLHEPSHDPEPEIREELAAFQAAGATVMVLAASSGSDDYDARAELSDEQWSTLLKNLEKLQHVAGEFGVTAVIHPHVGTVVETTADIARVVNGSRIGFCLDTGHYTIGGADPVQFAKEHADRIGHVHMKDVNNQVAARVISGELTYYQGVTKGLYTPLGQGDVDIASIISSLKEAHYGGWYVLEQDNVLAEAPRDSEGPIEDARASVSYLRLQLA